MTLACCRCMIQANIADRLRHPYQKRFRPRTENRLLILQSSDMSLECKDCTIIDRCCYMCLQDKANND